MKCEICSSEISSPSTDFLNKIAPSSSCSLPIPRLCADCRKQRRLSFRNERYFAYNKCAQTGDRIISVYAPESKTAPLKSELWHGDSWEALAFGREVDFTRPLLDQVAELLSVVPLEALFVANSENSEFTNMISDCKDCYLIFNTTGCQECQYSRGLSSCKSSLDLYFSAYSELCYDCVNISNCYNISFSDHCSQCRDSQYLFDCIGCANCLGCVNLRHKEYQILNKAVGKKEFLEELEKLKSYTYRKIFLEKYKELLVNLPHRAMHNFRCENSSGDLLRNTKSCENCFEVIECEDSTNCDCLRWSKDLWGCFGFGVHSELLYETVGVGRSTKVAFSLFCRSINDAYYAAFCENSSNIFGCVGVKNSKYCILNKQYSKEDYEKLIPKVVDLMRVHNEWGEFMHPKFSRFGYNRTVAVDYYPLEKHEALALGFNWEEYELPVAKITSDLELPDVFDASFKEILLSKPLCCEKSKRFFKLTPSEIDFHLKNNLPVPRLHPDQRHAERVTRCNQRLLFERECDNCREKIKSTYKPSRCEKIYCDDCFVKLI